MRPRRALPSALAHKLGGNSAVAVERQSKDGCEGGGGRPFRAREGRRGGAALRERPLPARLALAAARVPTLLPGLRAGAAAGARRVGANWVPAFPSPTRPSPQRNRSPEPDAPPGKLSRAPAWLNLAPTQTRPSPYPAGRPAASFITRPWAWLCASCGPTLSALNPGLSGPSKTHWHALPAFPLPSSQPSRPLLPLPFSGVQPALGLPPARAPAACGPGAHTAGPYSLQLSEGNVRRGRLGLCGSRNDERMLWAGGSGVRGRPFWEAEPAGAWSARSLNVCHLCCEFFVRGHLQVEFGR